MAVLTAGMVFLLQCKARAGSAHSIAHLRRTASGLLSDVSRSRSLDLVQARARENSTFIETARAIQSIKIFNRESGRKMLWSNRYADVIAANAEVECLKGGFKAHQRRGVRCRESRGDLSRSTRHAR